MLAELLALDAFAFLLIFARLGAAMMLLPGFGSRLLAARARLILALALTVVVLPVLSPQLPRLPDSPAVLVLLLAGEITVGFFLGMVSQALMVALNLAGTFIGFQSAMANAFIVDPVAEQQSSILPSFLANVALVLIFATDLHHLMLRAAIGSYDLFAPGAPLPLGDLANSLTQLVGRAFTLGLQLAGPVMVFGLVFNGGLGLLSRLMPQMQVYFVAMPLQVTIGTLLLIVTLPAMMMWFTRFFEEGLLPFAGGR
jgi:flagellar biosynthetic protein FliR